MSDVIKSIGTITELDGKDVKIGEKWFIIGEKPYQFINKLKVGTKAEFSINKDTITFFKEIKEETSNNTQKTPIKQEVSDKTYQDNILFNLCVKLASVKAKSDVPTEWAKETIQFANALYDEVKK